MTDARVRRADLDAQPGIRHPLLTEIGVGHFFGTRESGEPAGLVRPTQVHGFAVARPEAGCSHPNEADAIVAGPGHPVGIRTADCVPILAALRSGTAVAAIHAGWRGLARGIVAEGLAALRSSRTNGSDEIVAVIGPHIGVCCYEVDAPVVEPLRTRFGIEIDAALHESSSGHWLLDLAALVAVDLKRSGVPSVAIGRVPDACTRCDRERFHSFRRDGAEAGRMVHCVIAELS